MPPSLVLSFAAAVVVGIGSGALYRGAFTIVVSTASGGNLAGALASFFVAGYIGLSVPVVAGGIALQHVSFRVTLLSLSVSVAAGTLIAARFLLRLPTADDNGASPVQ